MAYDLLDASIRFASDRHAGQFRDGEFSLPYITHPIEVMMCLRWIEAETREPMLCAAVLHDVLEETDTEPAEIRDLFGSDVEALVVHLTRYEPTAHETRNMTRDQIWRLRAELLLAEIERMPLEAQRIKLADRLVNIRDAARTKSGKKLSRYVAQTHQILRIVDPFVAPNLHAAIRSELAHLPTMDW